MDLNKATELTYGTDTLPQQIGNENLTEPIPAGTAMDQTLPPSRPGTPQLSICNRKRQCVELIDFYISSIEFIKASLRHLQGKKPTVSQNDCHLDHIYNEHEQRLSDYTRLLDLTVSEFSSLGNCEIPGCAVHHTPHTSPVKNSIPDFPPLVKNTSTKRKETEIGFVSPPVNYPKI
ncbi:hypothetical protein TNCV_2144991 [Trichonephila clavipes]|nr:hypothetical protein TNCV_2144991 [Trichonephila clavipes]